MKHLNRIFQHCILSLSTLFFITSVQAEIPVKHIKGIDELFRSKYQLYSPIHGLIHSEQLIERFNDPELKPDEPVLKLFHFLFTKLPGGEITPSHLPKNPAAHLSNSAIAKIFIEYEKLKNPDLEASQLGQRIWNTIVTDINYQSSLEKAANDRKRAEQETELLCQQVQETRKIAVQAEELRKLQITPVIRKIKKLKANLKTGDLGSGSLELSQLEEERNRLESLYSEIRRSVINHEKAKEIDRKRKYIQETYDTESSDYTLRLNELVQTLVWSLMKNPDSTRVALLTYLWTKYTEKSDLREYLQPLAEVGFLKLKRWEKVHHSPERFFQDYYTKHDFAHLNHSFKSAWLKGYWIQNHVSDAIALLKDPDCSSKAPQIIPFSYWRWAKYSTFPDCCENALHNLFNLISFNPSTGKTDYLIFQQLKDQYYPQLNEKLIEYYKTYPTFAHHQSPAAARDWIQLVSNLDPSIHYRRSHTHVASPYSNLVKVVNSLFGIAELQQDQMGQIFNRVSSISNLQVQYSNAEIDPEGFGQANFKVNDAVFTLHSYRPVHVSFTHRRMNSNPIQQKLNQVLAVHFSKGTGTQSLQFKLPYTSRDTSRDTTRGCFLSTCFSASNRFPTQNR